MSEDVTVDTTLGSPTLTLDAGIASFTGAAGNVLTFTYTSEDGDNSSDLDVTALNLNGAVIEDAAGNAASFSGIATGELSCCSCNRYRYHSAGCTNGYMLLLRFQIYYQRITWHNWNRCWDCND